MAAKRRKKRKRSGGGTGQAQVRRKRRLGLMSIGCLALVLLFVAAVVLAVIQGSFEAS